MFTCSFRRGAINKAYISIAGLDTYNLDGSPLEVIITLGGGKSKERSISSLIEYLTRGTLSLIRRFITRGTLSLLRRFYYKKAFLVIVLE